MHIGEPCESSNPWSRRRVGVGVEVDHADLALPVVLGDGGHVGKRDRVVAAEDHRDGPAAQISATSSFTAAWLSAYRPAWPRHRRSRRRSARRTDRCQSSMCGRVGGTPSESSAFRIARGPKRVPGRFETASSNGAPTIATSTPSSSSGVSARGSFENVAMPRVARLTLSVDIRVIALLRGRICRTRPCRRSPRSTYHVNQVPGTSDSREPGHSLRPCRKSGPLAQLVEQGTFNPKVVGSIPTRPTRYRSSRQGRALGHECLSNGRRRPEIGAMDRWHLFLVQFCRNLPQRHPLQEQRVDFRAPFVVATITEPMPQPDIFGSEVPAMHLEPAG